MKKLQEYFDDCLFFSVNSLARSINKISEVEFTAIGLSSSYAFLLMAINEQPWVSTWEVSKAMNMDSSTITRFVEKLILQWYVIKEIEWRKTKLTLTKKWETIVKKDIYEAWCRVFKKYKKILWDELTEILTKNVNKADIILCKESKEK